MVSGCLATDPTTVSFRGSAKDVQARASFDNEDPVSLCCIAFYGLLIVSLVNSSITRAKVHSDGKLVSLCMENALFPNCLSFVFEMSMGAEEVFVKMLLGGISAN